MTNFDKTLEDGKKELNYYTLFIKSGLNIGFTDDQVDWLWYWIEKLNSPFAHKIREVVEKDK